jgi:hypothetical protein
MYDVKKLQTAADCRRVLERARARRMDEVYREVFRRLCELVGNENDDPDDSLVRDFYETLAAYEQLLSYCRILVMARGFRRRRFGISRTSGSRQLRSRR